MTCSPKYLIEPLMVLFMFAYISQVTYTSGIYQADMMFEVSKNETLVRLVYVVGQTTRNKYQVNCLDIEYIKTRIYAP